MAAAARPQLRGLLAQSTKVHATSMAVFATVNCLLCSIKARMAAAARPQLRGLLAQSTKVHAIGMAVFATVNVLLFKYFVRDARIKKYEDFYKYV